ncbi:hypothetical protein H0H92_004879 [Tricholoma furcatifolium]|nr:hypothetical protein H0H92_004879 [Tricholoma furcatifolium]
MDTPLHPPPISTKTIDAKDAEHILENFIEDFQERSTAAQGGNTAVTVQLQKLRDALNEEPKMKV